MLGDDAFEDRGCAGVVPDAVGVNDGDGAAEADPEAVGLGPQDQRGVLAEGGEALLEELPRGQALGGVAAFRFRGIGAEEDMALPAADSRRSCCCFQFRVHRAGGIAGGAAGVT